MNYTSPTDPLTPCPECGGGTYTFASGSIWCPSEDCQPGGRFVKRVAFERSPFDTGILPLPFPKRERKAIASQPAVAATASRKAAQGGARVRKADPFAVGMDTFIGEDAQ